MKKFNLFWPLVIFVFLLFLYQYAYEPINFLSGIKSYSGLRSSPDFMTYLNFYEREISGRSFFEWFTKLDKTNLSLVYFSFIVGFISKIQTYDFVFTSLIYCLIIYAFEKILRAHNVKSFYLGFTLITFISMIVYMQTITKEIMIWMLFAVSFVGVQRKNALLTMIAIFSLVIVRMYFAIVVILALILYMGYQKFGKRIFYYFLIGFGVVMPIMYKTIFFSFFTLPNVIYGVGINNYFISSAPYTGALLVWAPFRVFQNLSEPILGLWRIPISEYILHESFVLDSVTSLAILIMFVIVLFNYKKITKNLKSFPLFLAIFIGIYLLVIGIIPIIHFRYLALMLPVLGLFLDLTWKKNNISQDLQK